jgi:hypothetical protein
VERLDDVFIVRGATPQQCFDYIVDPDHGTEWNGFARSVEAHGGPGVGRRLEARIGFLGITFPLTTHVTVWDEPTDYVIEGSVPFLTRLGANLVAVAEGTEVDAFLEADPGRFFPVPRFALRKALKVQFDRDITNLRSHLEELAG